MTDSSPPAPSNPRRRLGWLLAPIGAAVGLAFGAFAAKLPFGPPLVMLGLGGMALVLTALALWRVLDPLVRPQAAVPLPPRAPARLRELEREKQMVLKAIKEIDLDFQMKKISEADHKELSHRYRARAMRLIQELDAGDDYRALIEQELKSRLSAEQRKGAG